MKQLFPKNTRIQTIRDYNVLTQIFFSNIVSALGGGLWTVVLGDWDRGSRDGTEVMMMMMVL